MVGMQNLGVNSDLCLEKSNQNAGVWVGEGEATSVMSLIELDPSVIEGNVYIQNTRKTK